MSDYPGNASLSQEVRDKILTTYRHTANLYQQGKVDDTKIGCEFILKMDPSFSPAQQLLDAAVSGQTIDPEALLAGAGGGASGVSLGEQAQQALDAREFSQAAALAQEAVAGGDRNAGAIGQQAQELLEAQPFVQQFLQKARVALEGGDAGEAGRQIDNAHAIDPAHPDISQLRAAVSESMAPGDGGFEFQGSDEPIGLASPPATPADPAAAPPTAAPPAGDAFGFQFAPEDGDASEMPTIGLAPPPSSPPETEAPAFSFEDAGEAPAAETPEFSFDAEPVTQEAPEFSFDAAPEPEAPLSFEVAEPPPETAPPPPVAPPPPAAAPPPPPPPAAGGEPAAFDFGSATDGFVAEAGQDDKVNQLLTEGDAAFQAGDFQGAIDVWSRIFLIDVTSQVASERIDQAKQAKAQRDEELAVIVAAGVELFQSGDPDAARVKFNEVLAVDPSNSSAKSYIEQIESGGGPVAGDDGLLGPSTAQPVGVGGDILSEDILGEPPPVMDDGEVYQGPADFPDPTASEPVPRAAPKKKIPVVLVLAVVGLLVVAGAAVWFTMFRDKGGDGAGPTPVVLTGEIRLERAAQLEALDKIGEAIKELEQVKADDPAYSDAIRRIDELRRKAAQADAPAPPPEIDVGQSVNEAFEDYKARGLAQVDQFQYLAAMPLLDQANRLQGGDLELERALSFVTGKVASLQGPLKQFNEGNYEPAIGSLWRLHQADPDNADVERLLVNAYYNLGVIELRTGTAAKAAERFGDVLELHPDDEETGRHRQLAERYRNRRKDLMYRTYTKYLQPRSS